MFENHLLEINNLTTKQIEDLIICAQRFKNNESRPEQINSSLINLFFENSTRTRISFELAAKNLGMKVVNFDGNRSSVKKGESILDTVSNLKAMGFEIFVVRHAQHEVLQEIANVIAQDGVLINAGSGSVAHPSQALLDVMTIVENKGSIDKLKIGIVGDIIHSRVASSLITTLKKLHCHDIRLIGPQDLLPEGVKDVSVETNLDLGLQGLDVIITLRMQQERFGDDFCIDLMDYKNNYQLNPKRLGLANESAIIMHPGPINRDIEIASELIDAPQAVILQQVGNGVLMRMAILEYFYALQQKRS